MVLLLCGCASTEASVDETYVVKSEDTLYSIAWRHGLDFRDLARWNGMGADYRIAVGQRLRLNPEGSAAPESSAPRAQAPAHGAVVTGRAPASSPPPPTVHNPAPSLAWTWPTSPPLAPRPSRGGLMFPGKLGQVVLAAAPGRVVYTGTGIRGYGELIIIKHSETLLSAYAFNRDVKVREGDEVNRGQAIAAIGQGAGQPPGLYFEIRLNGRPVNPLPFLTPK